jgi:uncharacterized protein with HEPN domain
MYLAARKVARFVGGLSKEKFLANEEKQFAVLHGLEIIGEAARYVSDDAKQQLDLIPWTEIRGMRNRLAHEYFAVDLEIVWDVLTDHLITLMQVLEQYVPQPPDESDDLGGPSPTLI